MLRSLQEPGGRFTGTGDSRSSVDGLVLWTVAGNGQQLAREVQGLLGTAKPLNDRAVLRLQLVDTGVDVDHHLARGRRDPSLGDADHVV